MQSTETKWSHLVKRGINSILGVIFLLGFIAPYSHIIYNNSEVKGLFGFPTMSSFLFAIGFPVFSIVLAILLNYVIYYLPRELKPIFRAFSLMTAFTGFYFFIWSLNPFNDKDFHPAFYYGSMILISILLSIIVKFYTRNSVRKLKAKIRYIMNLMINNAVNDGHVTNENRYEKEIIFPALDKLDEK